MSDTTSSQQSIPTPDSGSPNSSSDPVDNSSSHTEGNESGNDDDKKAGLRSLWWQHYDREEINGVWKAICKYCKQKLGGTTNAGTTHLKNHFINKHNKGKTGSMRQQVLTNNFNKDKLQLGSYSYDPETAKKELATAIIVHEYPLSIVEHVGFMRYSMALQPSFKVPCRNTIKREIFNIYEFEKMKTMSMVECNDSRVAITTDMWTSSNQKKGFMAVTGHFIDNSWKLQSRILRFIYVHSLHTKEVLCDQLLDCLMDWNMDMNISCVIVDNCSTNDAMIQLLLEKLDCSSLLANGSLFHMRCAAHILNLVVKDGLDVIKVGIGKIRDSVSYWTASPKREEKFEKTARQLRNPSTKKLGLDCPTRWNSTFLMLQTALLYKDVFSRLGQREPQYKSVPTNEEWEFAKEVCERLKILFKVTEIFSGTKYPTTNLCFTNICDIKIALREWQTCTNPVIEQMTNKMVEKFDKYWDVIHDVVGIAAVLDPRYKMDVLEFYFEELYGQVSASYRIDKVRSACYSLLEEYLHKLNSKKEDISESTSQSSTVTTCSSEQLSKYHEFVSRKKKQKKDNTVKLELDHYLEEEVLVDKENKFDVLGWWKSNAIKYPTLQLLARDMLAIPASTVASESAFSSSGRLVSPHRNRLHPDTLEALMCTQSWLWANEMNGESSMGYATIYNDVESIDSCITREV